MEILNASSVVDNQGCINPQNALGPSDDVWTGNTAQENWTCLWHLTDSTDPLTPGATQTVRVRVRRSQANGNDPSLNAMELWQNGVVIGEIAAAETVVSATGVDFVGQFNTSQLNGGQNLQVFLSVNGAGGPANSRRNIQVDSITLEADTTEDEPEPPPEPDPLPDVPANVQVAPATDSIGVSWDASANATSYEVRASQDWSTVPIWSVQSTTSTSFSVLRSSNRRVQIQVRAIGPGGESDWSSRTDTATLYDPSAPSWTPEQAFKPTGHGNNRPFRINGENFVLLAETANPHRLGVFRTADKQFMGAWSFQLNPLNAEEAVRAVSVYQLPGADTVVIGVVTDGWTSAVTFDGVNLGPVENIEQLPVVDNAFYYGIAMSISDSGSVYIVNGEDGVGLGDVLTEQHFQGSPGDRWWRSAGVMPGIPGTIVKKSNTELVHIFQDGLDIKYSVFNPSTQLYSASGQILVANAFTSVPASASEGWFRIGHSVEAPNGAPAAFVYSDGPGVPPTLVYIFLNDFSVSTFAGAENVDYIDGVISAVAQDFDGDGMLYCTPSGDIRATASEDFGNVDHVITTSQSAGSLGWNSEVVAFQKSLIVGNDFGLVSGDYFEPDEADWFVVDSWFGSPDESSASFTANHTQSADVEYVKTEQESRSASLVVNETHLVSISASAAEFASASIEVGHSVAVVLSTSSFQSGDGVSAELVVGHAQSVEVAATLESDWSDPVESGAPSGVALQVDLASGATTSTAKFVGLAFTSTNESDSAVVGSKLSAIGFVINESTGAEFAGAKGVAVSVATTLTTDATIEYTLDVSVSISVEQLHDTAFDVVSKTIHHAAVFDNEHDVTLESSFAVAPSFSVSSEQAVVLDASKSVAPALIGPTHLQSVSVAHSVATEGAASLVVSQDQGVELTVSTERSSALSTTVEQSATIAGDKDSTLELSVGHTSVATIDTQSTESSEAGISASVTQSVTLSSEKQAALEATVAITQSATADATSSVSTTIAVPQAQFVDIEAQAVVAVTVPNNHGSSVAVETTAERTASLTVSVAQSVSVVGGRLSTHVAGDVLVRFSDTHRVSYKFDNSYRTRVRFAPAFQQTYIFSPALFKVYTLQPVRVKVYKFSETMQVTYTLPLFNELYNIGPVNVTLYSITPTHE